VAPQVRVFDPQSGILGFLDYGINRTVGTEWANPAGTSLLELGPGKMKKVDGAAALEWPAWNAERDYLPFANDSIDAIYSTHFMEHLSAHGVRHILREAWRVLKVGGQFNAVIPHAQSTIYLHDIDHKTPFVIDTWKNILASEYYDKSATGLKFRIGTNFLYGIVERNVCLCTQLIKEDR
jgi:SAM-dependent methyltransferase